MPDDKPPPPKLSPAELEKVQEAILDGFGKADLQQVLRFKWGLILQRYINLNQGDYYIVGELLTWTEQRGKTRELMALAYAERPDNRVVREVAESLGISLPEAAEKYDLTKPLPPKPALEAMVVERSRFVDFGQFLNRFRSLGDRVCRIETPVALGTGFLVGPNLVLTNFHVIKGVDEQPKLAAQTICRFDYHAPADAGAGANGSKECRLAANWLVAKSPYSQSDITGKGEAGADELDYALVRLADAVGNTKAPQGNERGWFNLGAERPLLAARDFAVVPQHPRGRALEVAWGAVVEFNAAGNRVRYDTRTDEGSSGSPCFTVELEIFGLHHASDPVKAPRYNQAIPLDLIAKDLKDKGAV